MKTPYTSHHKHVSAVIATLALSLVGSAGARADAVVDPAKLSAHVKTLSSDAFEGRGPASPGEQKTVAYLIEQMKAAGLQPGGEMKKGARVWTQDVPLAQFNIDGPVDLSVSDGAATARAEPRERRSDTCGSHEHRPRAIKDAPLVFLGYGVTAPERDWDDYQGIDMRGKIAIVLVNDPDFETGDGCFGGRAMTYYGRWTYKYEEAARHGALGVLIVHETAPASYGWATVENSNTNAIFDILRTNPRSEHVDMEAWIQRDVAVGTLQTGWSQLRAAQEAGAVEILSRRASERHDVLRELSREARDSGLEERGGPVARNDAS